MQADMRSGKKCLFIVQDGLGDRPVAELGYTTPLEAAETPHMDGLIRKGVAGMADILAPGVKVGTDVGHLLLFGQDPAQGPFRRGPMEAAGIGILLQPGEIALRFNFATVDEQAGILDRRAGRIRHDTGELIKALNNLPVGEGVELAFHGATEHRGVLILKGEGLSAEISDSDPGDLLVRREILPVVARDSGPEARRTAGIVNRIVAMAREVLRQHPLNRERSKAGLPPANAILTRGAGGYRTYEPFEHTFGVRAACVSGECTVLGIARLSGVEPLFELAMTANLDTDLELKGKVALDALRQFDLVFLHFKGTDIAGHDRLPLVKKHFIERVDSLVGTLIAATSAYSDLYFAFTADHSTPSEVGEHSGDPVPIFLSGRDVRVDSVQRYGERFCAAGGLGRITCRDFLFTLIDYLR